VIAGATPVEVVRSLRDTLQRAVSCVTPDVLRSQTYTAESELTLLSRLVSRSSGPLTLSLRHFYAVLSDASRARSEHWQTQTTAYYYKVDDADGREILAYHWHPAGRSPETRPHLHLGAGAGTLRRDPPRASATGPAA